MLIFSGKPLHKIERFFALFIYVNKSYVFSVGSMLALDRPYISSSMESAGETSEDLCLEYGSATQLYVVPSIQHEEQVSHGP